MNIADRIQNLRKSKGVSQEELADKIGVSRQAVSKWESEQSVPDLDKVIIMSNYFEVTTDYILKGIENNKQAGEPVNASIFVILATALNFIGVIVACAIWYEQQTSMAIVIGLIIMAVGCALFAFGQLISTKNTHKARRTFWMTNVWLLVFTPLSFIYNVLFTAFNAPYPLFGNPTFALPLFWLVYITAYLGVVFMQIKASRKE